MVARKAQVHAKASMRSGPAGTALTLEKSRLTQERQLAVRRNDLADVERIDAQLAQLLQGTQTNRSARSTNSVNEVIARVNERNRKANLEAVRKAEILEAERKRRDRKHAVGTNGTATPIRTKDSRLVLPCHLTISFAIVSLFVDHWICPPLHYSRARRPGTPGTPFSKTALGTPRSNTPVVIETAANSKHGSPDASFEASVIESVEVDLGDF